MVIGEIIAKAFDATIEDDTKQDPSTTTTT
jgi:hypothetical protein